MQLDSSLPFVRSRIAVLAEQPALVLGTLVVAQWVAVVAFALGTQRNGLLFYQGGDQTYFYTTAWSLSEGYLPRTGIGYAWPTVLAPIALVAGPSFLAALPAILALQFLVLLPVSLLLVYAIATHVGGRPFGYWAAALWVAIPYLAIPLFVDRYHPQFAEQFLPHALGLTGLGDYSSTVAVLLAAWLVLRALDEKDVVAAVVAGLAAGFAIGIKPANVFFLPAAFLALAIGRRWREGVAFGIALLPAVLTLAIWKGRGLGTLPILAFAETRAVAGAAMLPVFAGVGDLTDQISWERLQHNFDGLREFFWSVRVLEVVPIAGAVAVARVSAAKAVFFGAWLGVFLVFKGSSDGATVESGSFFRLLMPAFPAYFMLMAAIPLLVPTLGPRVAEAYAVRRQRLAPRSRWVAAAVVVLAIVPLVLVSVLPQLREPLTVSDYSRDQFLPVDRGFDPSARADPSGGVELRWPEAASGGSHVQYQIWRSPPVKPAADAAPPPVMDGVRCRAVSGGAQDCAIEMEVIGSTEERVWRDQPPPGRWVYRVGLLAGWRAEAESADVVLVSDPAVVTVP